MKTGFRALTLFILLVPSMALAHSGPAGHTHGFAQGFLHPLGGIDHVLAMVAVGLLVAHLGGRALLLVPASFVTVMAAGGALGFTGFALPYTELAIALSVIVLGALVAFRANLSLALASLIAGGFAIFHGYAHGAEMAIEPSALWYGLGLMLATAALHGVGIGVGLTAQHGVSARLLRFGGAAIAAGGALLLVG
ncbi:MAG: HupE/UreJ family protein [Burkholderiales bacterium]|nr:HupE/UreJ family protein [Burkholderiales bacterium]